MAAQIYLTNLSVKKSNAFSELNPLGIYIYNSPQSYLKFGSGEAIIKANDLQVGNISVLGNMYIYGTKIVGSTSSDLSGTTLPTFTIGTGINSDNTSLIFGNYTTSNALTSNGTKITSTVPIDAPTVYKNGKELGSYSIKQLLLNSDVAMNANVDIPDSMSYIMGEDKLLIFVDGRLQINNVDYTEYSTTQVRFLYDLAQGARITFLIIGW